ncbi:MAG TPA: hypothetical protein VM325_14345 [Alphaproteobacteria bacterium]|nr:hypothetical protein [Alphaproteobacteria bacterium]
MRYKSVLVAGLMAFAVTAMGCGTAQQRASYTSLPIAAKSNPTLEQVTGAIMRAGPAKNWQMKLVRPGLVEASRSWEGGKHSIAVNVTYDAGRYSIEYKSSVNLKARGNSIHWSYNREVNRLNDEIQRQTAKL